MWKCKKCGCEKFHQDISGGYSEITELDENGCVVNSVDYTDYGIIYCTKCGNDGNDIDEIARWEDE